MKTLKTTILGGVFFLIPLVVIGFFLAKAFEFTRKLSVPIGRIFPMDRIAGVAMPDILAVVLILLICYLFGLIARGKFLSSYVDKVDEFLISMVPGYAVFKGILSGVMGEQTGESLLRPVLVRLDDFDQIAFEVEKLEDRSVVFLPGAPSAWSGVTVIVAHDRITDLSLPPHQITGLLRVLGRGTAKLNLPRSANPAE